MLKWIARSEQVDGIDAPESDVHRGPQLGVGPMRPGVVGSDQHHRPVESARTAFA